MLLLRYFLHEINISTIRVCIKADYPPSCGRALSNQLTAWREKRLRGRVFLLQRGNSASSLPLGLCCNINSSLGLFPGLLDHMADFCIASLHNCVNQFPKINLSPHSPPRFSPSLSLSSFFTPPPSLSPSPFFSLHTHTQINLQQHGD